MGNRAFICTRKKDLGVYLHWNGGRDSIEAFLKYCELQNFRCPESDSYGWARLVQVIANFFGGSTSIGIGKYYDMNEDNGIYVIENWQIVDRLNLYEGFTEQNEYELNEMLKEIDKQQPLHMQLGAFLDAEEINAEDVKIGDNIFMYGFDGYEKFTVVGFGEDKVINGTNVKGLPFVNKYLNDDSYANNINNFIRTKTIRKVKE
jgi:hypothetical protein